MGIIVHWETNRSASAIATAGDVLDHRVACILAGDRILHTRSLSVLSYPYLVHKLHVRCTPNQTLVADPRLGRFLRPGQLHNPTSETHSVNST